MSVFANVCIFGSPLSFVRFRLKVTPQTAWTTTRTTTRRTRTTTRTATTTTTTTTANRSQEDTKVSPSSDSKGSFLAPLACLSVPPVQQTPRTVPVSLAQPWDARVDGEDYVLPNTFKSKKPTLSKVQTPKDPRQASQDNVFSNPFRKNNPTLGQIHGHRHLVAKGKHRGPELWTLTLTLDYNREYHCNQENNTNTTTKAG
jgi:hypothetical protein